MILDGESKARERRRRAVLANERDLGGGLEVNGIDFVEVEGDDTDQGDFRQRILIVRFLKPDGLMDDGGDLLLVPEDWRIEGGERIRGIDVLHVAWAEETDGQQIDEQTVALTVGRAGDHSNYVLRLLRGRSGPGHLANMDPLLSSISFSFKAGCASSFDCRTLLPSPPRTEPQPRLDYLAKDYGSFRRLMLDRMTQSMPDWDTDSPADFGVTLVEALAYAADHASYYQDAVATEAYLSTCRQRVSAKRHSRLLGYPMHEGSNARVFVTFEVAQDIEKANSPALPKGTQVWSGSQRGGSVFETMHDVKKISVAKNAIPFHTWGEDQASLPPGSTSAFLSADAATMDLEKGDVLILEELVPRGGGSDDPPDPSHRQAVRLERDPVEIYDPLADATVLEVHWHRDDALPFRLNLIGEDGSWGAVARANVVLADHGETRGHNGTDKDHNSTVKLDPEMPVEGVAYRPRLEAKGISYAVPFDPEAARDVAASKVFDVDPAEAIPAVRLMDRGFQWSATPDLLLSGRFSTDFVVEVDDDDVVHLRFGDGVFGRRPGLGALRPIVRLGCGPAGNLEAESLNRVEHEDSDLITRVRNPIAASGGVSKEPLTSVKIRAPHSFKSQKRAVTLEDYAREVESHEQVQRAVAEKRWTGSWDTIFIAIDRLGGGPLEETLQAELREHIESRRMAGRDVVFEPPIEVPLDIALVVCVREGHEAAHVEKRLLRKFGVDILEGGVRGYFHPDNFSFGRDIYLSDIIAHAMTEPGVRFVGLQAVGTTVRGKFRRLHDQGVDYGDQGIIPLGRREIPRLDNDPNAPERGRLEFLMEEAR